MLDDALTVIKGIGCGRAELFAALGLFTIRDLLYFTPREYRDYSSARRIDEIEHGEYAAIRAEKIGQPKFYRIRGEQSIVCVSISDGFGTVLAEWFNQPYASGNIPKAPGGYIMGRMDRNRGARLVNAVFSNELPGIVPIYQLTKKLNQGVIRKAVRAAVDAEAQALPELIGADLRRKFRLVPIEFAIHAIHFPSSMDALEAAKRRMAFEDALTFTIALEMIRMKRSAARGIAFDMSGTEDEFLKMLPFTPTGAQLRVMREIAGDMARKSPMNRLVQGDVGSGKTIIAIYAMFAAMKNGFQSVLMAPTEILAEQHYIQLRRFFGDKAAIVTGSMGKRELSETLAKIENGELMAVTGTHALIEDRVAFGRLGLVITDEQHRFGVRQRALLEKKSGGMPDTLIMSATPIPRTLALILYGDLDISAVDEVPPGRKPVATYFVRARKRVQMYRYIEKSIKERNVQAYVVCPMIEDGDDESGETGLAASASANAVYDELKTNLSVRVGLMHGRLKAEEKDAVMNSFRAHELDLLVSTTVIEVGVDVPNACIMVIESAERFGLAQLHQLRGRVGRGAGQSSCFLLSESRSMTAMDRLKTLISTNDGFEIAEKDLELRGPGQFIGTRQHGASELGAAALAMDVKTLAEARDAAIYVLRSKNGSYAALTAAATAKYSRMMNEIAIN